jgi:hypothetical protein
MCGWFGKQIGALLVLFVIRKWYLLMILNIHWGDVQQPFAGSFILAALMRQSISTSFNKQSASNS